jgi:hypothetical protein|nr:MAG TPA: hypothetical protein [Caudoviricetes sp.]
MKIDVCYDLEDVQPSRLQLQRGEKLQLEVWFHGPNWDKVYDPGLAIKFGAKEAGKYASSEPIMVYCDTFVLDESGCYKGVLQLNTTNLLNLIGDEKSVTLDAQFEFSGKDTVYKTKLLKLVVSNDIIKGDEGVPVPAPSYVTKDELGQEVKSQVDDIMSDKMDEMAGMANDAASSAEAAEQSKNNAATSATNAANSESLAQKWAINPRDLPVTGSGATAKYSALHWATYGQQYAQTASDAATSAASSRADCELFKQFAYQQAQASANSAVVSTNQAKIAADLVAGVAGVGDQVEAAQNAAATAASKATEAANSAMDAANSATSADSSKKAAATSASNAKTSETNAANSAKSAADSKTACEGILSQMQGLLRNVPLLDGDNVFTGNNTFKTRMVTEGGITFTHPNTEKTITIQMQDIGNLSFDNETGIQLARFDKNSIFYANRITTLVNFTSAGEAVFKNGIINESGIYYTKTGTPVQIGAVTTAADGVYHGWLVMNNGEVNGAQLSAKAMTTTGVSPDPVLAFTGRTAVLYEGGLDMRSHKILNVASGTAPTDAATVAQAGSGGSVPENVITTDNIAEHAVTELGGKHGALGIGTNLSFSGNTLNASGGGGSGSVDLSNYRGNVSIADHSGYNILKYDSDSDTITIGFSSRKVHVESFDFEVQTQDHVSLSMGSGVFEIDNNSEIRMVANGLFYNDTPINPYATPLDI